MKIQHYKQHNDNVLMGNNILIASLSDPVKEIISDIAEIGLDKANEIIFNNNEL